MVFAIYWHESAMDLHVFPIPIPPPTFLPTASRFYERVGGVDGWRSTLQASWPQWAEKLSIYMSSEVWAKGVIPRSAVERHNHSLCSTSKLWSSIHTHSHIHSPLVNTHCLGLEMLSRHDLQVILPSKGGVDTTFIYSKRKSSSVPLPPELTPMPLTIKRGQKEVETTA